MPERPSSARLDRIAVYPSLRIQKDIVGLRMADLDWLVAVARAAERLTAYTDGATCVGCGGTGVHDDDCPGLALRRALDPDRG